MTLQVNGKYRFYQCAASDCGKRIRAKKDEDTENYLPVSGRYYGDTEKHVVKQAFCSLRCEKIYDCEQHQRHELAASFRHRCPKRRWQRTRSENGRQLWAQVRG